MKRVACISGGANNIPVRFKIQIVYYSNCENCAFIVYTTYVICTETFMHKHGYRLPAIRGYPFGPLKRPGICFDDSDIYL